MKRVTPMKAKKDKGSMEEYADKRNQEIRRGPPKHVPIESIRAEIMHDPEMDLHTLSRAAEIKMNKHRHQAAKQAAKKKRKMLDHISKDQME